MTATGKISPSGPSPKRRRGADQVRREAGEPDVGPPGAQRRSRSAWALASDLALASSVASAVVVVLFDGHWQSGFRFLLVFGVLLVPRHFGAPRPFEAAFGIALVSAAWASAVHLYQAAWWVDVVIHFVLGGATSAMLYLVFAQVGLLPDLHEGAVRHHRASPVILAVALGLAAGTLWELYEWVATSIFPNASIAVGYDDTVLDLTMDGSGSLVAGFVLLAWRRAGRSTDRRPEGNGAA